VGLVIQRDQFPDRLFAPPKRDTLMEDGTNPVYDKEIRSEIFSQGTLMLRLVIQVSMLLAIPLMGVCLYLWPAYARWYVGYVIVFNMLVGPVFSAGSVTSERERQTLDLLLTTVITPSQILWGKLLAGLRVSSVLTLFLLWPLLLACVMVEVYWTNLAQVVAYLIIVLLTCVLTASIALFCSVLFRKTSVSLMSTYLVIVALFCLPLAVNFFTQTFFPDDPVRSVTHAALVTSPFAATFALPLADVLPENDTEPPTPEWWLFGGFVVLAVALVSLLVLTMEWLFNVRWRVAE
jgi:ABC-type transport system involved in multi-copper enzyme maturation permease subunit